MSIGERLRKERERLGLNQPTLADIAKTTKKTQIEYEKNITSPKALYLAEVAKLGIDIQYIITGIPSVNAMSSQEMTLLEQFRSLDEKGKGAVLGAMYGYNNPMTVQIGNVHAVNSLVKITGIGQ